MAITEKDVRHVATLARLALTDEEAVLYTDQLQKILGYVEQLSSVDTEGVIPTTHAIESGALMRRDGAGESLPVLEALGNAPQAERECFKVPKIIE